MKEAKLPTAVQHQAIYQHYAAEYDLLRSRMDYENNLLKVINELVDVAGCTVVELAAGTGRLTQLVAPRASTVYAFDSSESMLAFARQKFSELGFSNIHFDEAINQALPIPEKIADVVIEGWSLGYVANEARENWKLAIDQVIEEMERVCKPGGTLLIFGTLGTGAHNPKPPNSTLAALYAYLESEKNFEMAPWFKTDYAFESVEEAERLSSFFWSANFGQLIRERQMKVVPECTAVWHKKLR